MSEIVIGAFLLLGGIGLFLFGINFMSVGLERAAGNKLRSILEKMTKNSVMSVLVGVLVTMLIQSSGATSVMVVSFVDAELMELSRALYVMLGANIGTTVTAQIIAFKIDLIAPLILFIGVILYQFVKNRTVRKIGAVVLGFGILFVGIYLMGKAVDSLNLTEVIGTFINNFNNPVLGVLFGVVITSVIQSSSASIGILQVLVAQAAGSVLGLASLVYIIMGMNIGACAPIVIISFSGNRKSKQCALSGVLAKVFGVLFFSAVLFLFPGLVGIIERLSPGDVSRQIANFHLLFNVVSTVVLFPFVNMISKLVTKLLPELPGDEFYARKLIYISPESALTPAVSVQQAKREAVRMAEIALSNLTLAVASFFESDGGKADKVLETEDTINYLNHQITGYLVQLHGQNLDSKDIEAVGMMLRVVSDIERVGDHAENIAEYTENLLSGDVKMTPDALEELREISSHSIDVLTLSIDVYKNSLFGSLGEVSRLEEEVDGMQERFIENHINRLKNDRCSPLAGVIFTDMVTDLERCSDHAINIAFAINGEKTTVTMKKAYIVTRGNTDD